MTKRGEMTWEIRIANIVAKAPRIGAVEIVDRLSRESYLSSRWGKTDACRTIQDMANAGKLVREWDERGEVFYTVAA